METIHSCESGSSPRGRGKRRGGRAGRLGERLIPAWAGKTKGEARALLRDRAHPRVGGENSKFQPAPAAGMGSSPRGRGKQNSAKGYAPSLRLIPAWAGKTKASFGLSPVMRAHPRVGGENGTIAGARLSASGSSPRGRGKPCPRNALRSRYRLIPAWAGKTIFVALYQNNETAHPRVGGENGLVGPFADVPAGSSPRGRGKPPPLLGHLAASGLIPAWAGKTRCPRRRASDRRAHPRVGGENHRPDVAELAINGSSPRGRGKLRLELVKIGDRGLIPAWAGKTSMTAPSPSRRTAHPRVGGENPLAARGAEPVMGSSPRGRGKPR